jgi:hypothetical protein
MLASQWLNCMEVKYGFHSRDRANDAVYCLDVSSQTYTSKDSILTVEDAVIYFSTLDIPAMENVFKLLLLVQNTPLAVDLISGLFFPISSSSDESSFSTACERALPALVQKYGGRATELLEVRSSARRFHGDPVSTAEKSWVDMHRCCGDSIPSLMDQVSPQIPATHVPVMRQLLEILQTMKEFKDQRS